MLLAAAKVLDYIRRRARGASAVRAETLPTRRRRGGTVRRGLGAVRAETLPTRCRRGGTVRRGLGAVRAETLPTRRRRGGTVRRGLGEVDALDHAGEREDAHRRRPTRAQAPRAFADRGAGGKDVVHDEDVSAGHQLRPAQREGAANIGPPG